MSEIVFKCLQCGDCCKNLLKEPLLTLQGLSLSFEEAKLFPKELVLPQTGIGMDRSGKSKPEYIISYQLKVPVCPFISDKNKCRIYENRPLSCRAFPLLRLGPYGTVTSEDCRFIKNTEQKLGRRLDETVTPKSFRTSDEWQALMEMDKRIMQSFINYHPDVNLFWVFNLKTKEWEISG